MKKISPQEIKEQYLDKNGVKMLLQSLGYHINKTDKFKLREEEKTPSAIVNINGTIHDYGDGFHGDIYKLLLVYHGMQFRDAFAWVKEQFGIYDVSTNNNKSINISEVIEKEIENFVKAAVEICTFKNTFYRAEALSIAPLWVYNQANKKAIAQFQNFTTYDTYYKTLIIKIFDYSGRLISYKRRRIVNMGKWITRKDTHPNNQCMQYIVDERFPIYVVEGHHDFLTGILLNSSNEAVFNVFMVPTVNYSEFNSSELKIFQKREVVFLPDLSEDDKKGIEAFTALAEQIDDDAIAVHIVNLEKFMKESEDIDLKNKKIDLSNVVEASIAKNSSYFVNSLHYYICTVEGVA